MQLLGLDCFGSRVNGIVVIFLFATNFFLPVKGMRFLFLYHHRRHFVCHTKGGAHFFCEMFNCSFELSFSFGAITRTIHFPILQSNNCHSI